MWEERDPRADESLDVGRETQRLKMPGPFPERKGFRVTPASQEQMCQRVKIFNQVVEFIFPDFTSVAGILEKSFDFRRLLHCKSLASFAFRSLAWREFQ